MTKQKKPNFQWLRLLDSLWETGQAVNSWSWREFKCAIGWSFSGAAYMDGKILRGRPMAQVFVFQLPWGKPRGFRISRHKSGIEMGRWDKECPAVQMEVHPFLGVLTPARTIDTAIPDAHGISINSTLEEIRAAMKRESGNPTIQ